LVPINPGGHEQATYLSFGEQVPPLKHSQGYFSLLSTSFSLVTIRIGKAMAKNKRAGSDNLL